MLPTIGLQSIKPIANRTDRAIVISVFKGLLTARNVPGYCSQHKTTRWALSKESVDLAVRNTNSPRSLRKFGLHPLIHTQLEFALVQDAEEKKGAKDSAFS